MLTVREVARVQGFKDDSLFYGSTTTQHNDVYHAHPPVVSRAVGKMLCRVMDLCRTGKGSGGVGAMAVGENGNGRPSKRARVNDAEEEGG